MLVVWVGTTSEYNPRFVNIIP